VAVITYDDVKVELDMDEAETKWDTLLTNLCSAIQSIFDLKTGRTIEETAHTEYYSADMYTSEIYLKNFPVKSGASFSLYDDPDWQYGSDTLISASDYKVSLTDGIIYYISHFFRGKMNIKVIYTAGYTATTLPDAHKQIFVRQCSHWFKDAKNGEWHIDSMSIPQGGNIMRKRLDGNLLPEFENLVMIERRIQSC